MSGRHEIVLLDAVAAHPQAAHERATGVDPDAPREEYDATLVAEVVGIAGLGADVEDVTPKIAEEWTG
jgi:hypothetical protein